VSAPALPGGAPRRLVELRKIAAFLRRDVLVLLSYRAALVTDWVSLLAQVFLFAFISRLISPDALPAYGGRQPSYLEFVALGIVISSFLNVGLSGLVGVVRAEQTMGTLEQVLSTPVRLLTFQVGSGLLGLLYTPLRMLALLVAMSLLLGGDFAFANLGPAAMVVAAFLPVVWGIGLAGAGTVLTVRRGGNVAGFAGMLLGAASGAYFPVSLLPGWLETAMRANPVTIALEALRATLLGGQGWAAVAEPVLLLLPMGVVAIVLGSAVFRLALRRELRKGTLNLY
jgi:ABC-2 type transport system permease protein